MKMASAGRAFSIAQLADLLSQFNKPTADNTGLTGKYDFKLTWNDDEGPTLANAIQEQLGLRLQSQKVPVTYIIIDSAQKPTEN